MNVEKITSALSCSCTRTLRAIQSRIRAAKFPEKKDIDNFIFTDTPISQEQIMHLYSCEFVNSSRNIVLIGGAGTGKTRLAIAISARAVRKGYKSKFFNLVDLANQLGCVVTRFESTLVKPLNKDPPCMILYF
ncbi:ATP-binding protein [Rickettsia endosymbiont of Culicoides newsteadi]|uniref:ATP-binding protein n=1 Tax=Rickettsia endosymbiont of Culicoides newsteadi TaxID=1961830 RepID=UPI00397AA83B